MKKAFLTLLMISTIIVFAGCGQQQFQNGFKEETTVDANGHQVITRTFQNGAVSTELYEDNKITRTHKSPDGNIHETVEITSTDENGNKVVTRTSNDGSKGMELYEGNKITRTNTMPNGQVFSSVEETFDDGTRVITHTNPQGRLYKMTEKDLGNGKRQTLIENQREDGSIEKIEELHENLGEGKNKMTQKYEDGRVQVMIMTHKKNEDMNETTITYPDGRVEKTTEKYFHKKNGITKVERINADGKKEIHTYGPMGEIH